MSASRKKQQKKAEGTGPLLRLLAACVVFLACCGAKTCFPEETAQYRQQLSALLSSTTDFKAAFTRLGQRLEEGEDVMGAVGDWCVTVFAPEPVNLPDSEEPLS